MSTKKYHWIKMDRHFFKRHDIRIIEGMENGKDYVLLYLKLLLESIDHEGHLRFNDLIPYNQKMIATITNTNIDIVRSGMDLFEKLGFIEIYDDETIYITETQKMLGAGKSTERVRRFRERQKALENSTVYTNETLHETQGNVTETLHETEKEKELEKELDKEKERESKTTRSQQMKLGSYKNVRLTEKELDNLNEVYPEFTEKYIEDLSLYLAKTGKRYKSHSATIRTWIRRDLESGKIKQTTKQSSSYGTTY